MPMYLDRHDLVGVTAADPANAHLKDLDVQEEFGVQFVTYWFDYERQTAFCLANGPTREAVNAVHAKSHGLVANEVIEVDSASVRRFLGPMRDHEPGEPHVETAFRTIVFTDIEGSTNLTQRMGDRGAMEMVRLHDRLVRAALNLHSGTEVKHTGDGILASFVSVSGAIAAAIEVQRRLSEEIATQPFRFASASAWRPVSP